MDVFTKNCDFQILKYICETVIFQILKYIWNFPFGLLCNFYDFEIQVIQKWIIITLVCHVNHWYFKCHFYTPKSMQ